MWGREIHLLGWRAGWMASAWMEGTCTSLQPLEGTHLALRYAVRRSCECCLLSSAAPVGRRLCRACRLTLLAIRAARSAQRDDVFYTRASE